jgi:hypothetical protein
MYKTASGKALSIDLKNRAQSVFQVDLVIFFALICLLLIVWAFGAALRFQARVGCGVLRISVQSLLMG